MLKCLTANVRHILRAKKKSFPLLLFIQQILPEYARLVFGAVDLRVNKIGMLSACRPCGQVGQ